MTEVVYLLLSLLLVLACGGFVAAEFAFVTVDRAAVDRAAESGDRRAAGVQSALRSLSTQLSGAQVGITVTNLAIGFLAEPAVSDLIDGPLATAGVPDGVVTPLIVYAASTFLVTNAHARCASPAAPHEVPHWLRIHTPSASYEIVSTVSGSRHFVHLRTKSPR